jgi:hypothetical protein
MRQDAAPARSFNRFMREAIMRTYVPLQRRKKYLRWAMPLVVICACVGAANAADPPAQNGIAPASSMKAWRKAAADRQRRMLFNNDGNEAVHEMARPSAEDFLQCRTSFLAGTQVDAISYCTTSSFGMFKHLSKFGQVFTLRMEPHPNNQLQAMAELGLDPLKIMADFCRRSRMDLFWSFRMNDVHDKGKTDYEVARFRFNKLKTEHPEYLMGTPRKRPKIGGWSAVNYGLPEIRDFAFRAVEEICRGYDVAGVELDFFRHPVFFRSTTRGLNATDEDRAQMTDLLQRIRTLADEVGKNRGHPILIAVRTPDSVEYARNIGLDIEHWMADDLIDLWMAAGYFQLNDWDYSVALARKYGVKVYPSLDESRNRDESAKQMRMTGLAYRGRAANVWSAGADGVYLFNSFDPTSPLWRELGDPKLLAKMDKDYFASVRGAFGANGGNLPFESYQKYETLNPMNPKALAAGKNATACIRLGENFRETKPATLTLRLRFDVPPKTDAVRATVNGNPLKLEPSGKEWLEAKVQPAELREGGNVVGVSFAESAPKANWTDLMLQVRHASQP